MNKTVIFFLAMICSLAVQCAYADEVVSSAAGGWCAVDTRAVKDTTWEGGAIVGGATNVVLQSSPNAWGEAGGGASATIRWWSTSGGEGIVAEETTTDAVVWKPEARVGTNTLFYLSGTVMKTARFSVVGQPGYTTTTTVPVPFVWLEKYYPGTPDYEATAKLMASNGVNTVEEAYVAGLVPTNAASVFQAVIAVTNGTVYVSWSPNLNEGATNRIYTVSGREELQAGAWASPYQAWHRFFKVSVSMPTGAAGEQTATPGEGFIPAPSP